ncbi:Glycerol-3-phosphate dehydrogenase (NAD(P)(+)) [Kineococcus radiotolerans SRS30216 = ATCC BAA-149]|uniref:Glycerol-3-phosphate dehydrogenase [NAD(P)+] n=1 Tax=Kineococcus radiotolerans (strain ATCC BAA-149 / DSM 14245 / SRS30216) TaxID=266940 RepID=A6W8G2_KINRD|nr:Glycerol-3-phosphate dehydrogenase (NAD(P)(+)) [Kineococcus radiotolerans SRS30216 = ATCC BAA-149]
MAGVHVAVLGSGAWGTAVAGLLAANASSVGLWCRRPELAERIRVSGRNEQYLPGIDLPARVHAGSRVEDVVEGAELVVLAVPLQRLRSLLLRWREVLPAVPVVNLAKGVETSTGLFGSEVVADVLDGRPVLALSGPNLALEIARGQPAATVVACVDAEVAGRVATWCSTPDFHAHPLTDVVGVDVAGAVKNVVALAVGMVEGAGLGANARAAVTTLGLTETAELGRRLGARLETFLGLAGAGDLVATSTSTLSRNHRVGVALGEGLPLAEALVRAGGTAEGVATAPALLRRDPDLPFVRDVVAVLDGQRSPVEAVTRLLTVA